MGRQIFEAGPKKMVGSRKEWGPRSLAAATKRLTFHTLTSPGSYPTSHVPGQDLPCPPLLSAGFKQDPKVRIQDR